MFYRILPNPFSKFQLLVKQAVLLLRMVEKGKGKPMRMCSFSPVFALTLCPCPPQSQAAFQAMIFALV